MYSQFLLLSLLALATFTAVSVHGQQLTRLTMTVTGQDLTAGFDNNVTISLKNSYTTIYDTDIAISLPASLTLIGDNHWHYDSIDPGETVTISFQAYATTSGIGSTYQGSLTATYKQLGDVSYTQESHALSFSVYGWLSLTIYDVQMTPSSSTPGGNVTVSGNLLNSGNLAAYNANVTAESESLAPDTLPSTFIGEVDPNIPRPFSLLLIFKSNLSDGNYTVIVRVSAIDNNRPALPITSQHEGQIQIKETPQQSTPSSSRRETSLTSLALQIVRSTPTPILPIIITGLLVGFVTKNTDRRLSKKKLGLASMLAGILNGGETYLLILVTPTPTFQTGVAIQTGASTARQGLDLTSIVFSILLGLLIPLTIMGIGMLYSRAKKDTDENANQDSANESD